MYIYMYILAGVGDEDAPREARTVEAAAPPRMHSDARVGTKSADASPSHSNNDATS